MSKTLTQKSHSTSNAIDFSKIAVESTQGLIKDDLLLEFDQLENTINESWDLIS